jgi:hypothetical protein
MTLTAIELAAPVTDTSPALFNLTEPDVTGALAAAANPAAALAVLTGRGCTPDQAIKALAFVAEHKVSIVIADVTD